MALVPRPKFGLQNATLSGGEKFMGAAEQVPPPGSPNAAPQGMRSAGALPAPAAPAPVNNGINLAKPTGMHPPLAEARATQIGRAAGQLVGKVAPVAGRLIGGAVATAPLAGFNDYKIKDDEVDSSLMGTLGYAAKGEFGKAWDSQRKGAVEAGLDGLSGLAKTGDAAAGLFGFQPGLSESLSGMVRGDLGKNVIAPESNATRSAAREANFQGPGMVAAAAAAKTAQNAAKRPELAGTPMEGQAGVRRVLGDSQHGVPLYTNATSDAADFDFATKKGGMVSTVGNMGEANAINQRALDVMKEMRGMREGQLDHNDISAYADSAGKTPGGLNAELSRQIRRLGGVRTSTANQAMAQLMGVQAQLRNQDLDSNDKRAALDQNAKLAGMTARQKQMQDDRDFNLRANEFGLRQQVEQRQGGEAAAKREMEGFQRSQGAAKAMNERFTAAATNPDGTVDKARQARYKEGATQYVTDRQNSLKAEIAKGGPNAAQAQQELDYLDKEGVAALGEGHLAEIVSAMDLGDRANQTAGLFGGTGVRSKNPNDYKVTGRKQNIFGSDSLILGENGKGGSIRAADAAFTKPGNYIIPNSWTNTPTTDFDLAKKGMRK